MDPELEKKIKRVEPTKAESKRLYDQPLRVLRRGPDRKMKGFPKRPYRSEAEEIFFSIRWDEAWQQFLERNSDGRFKYKTVFELSSALAIGINAQVRKHRAGYIYSAIGPVSASDKTKKVPYLGDWDMLRSQLAILRRLARFKPADVVALSRAVAAHCIAVERYPF